MSRDLVAENNNCKKRWQSQHDIFLYKPGQPAPIWGGSAAGNEQHPGLEGLSSNGGCYTDERPRLTRSEDLARNVCFPSRLGM